MDYDALDGELQAGNAVFRKETEGSTGYLTGRYAKEHKQYLLDFLASSQVYDITNGNRVPVIIEGGTYLYQDDDRYDHYARFRAIEGYNNHSFSPDEV